MAKKPAPKAKRLTHLDAKGNARMVDLGGKAVTSRVATATGSVLMAPATVALIRAGGFKKGDVLSIARIAGIMGAKKTPELIPLCHPIFLTSVAVDLTLTAKGVDITATCKIAAQTGIEMEALTAVSVAALTVYDMCKAVDRSMTITGIHVTHKSGGKSGTYEAK